jgi:hypothetical protein
MKVSMTINSELKFLESLFELTKAKMGAGASNPEVLAIVKVQAKKLVGEAQITQEALDMFLEDASIDEKLQAAKVKSVKAKAEFDKLLKQKDRIARAKLGGRQVVSDPCSRSVVQSHC